MIEEAVLWKQQNVIRVCSGQLWEHRGAQTEEAAEPTSAACENSTLCVSVCVVSGDLDENIACYREHYYGHNNEIWSHFPPLFWAALVAVPSTDLATLTGAQSILGSVFGSEKCGDDEFSREQTQLVALISLILQSFNTFFRSPSFSFITV